MFLLHLLAPSPNSCPRSTIFVIESHVYVNNIFPEEYRLVRHEYALIIWEKYKTTEKISFGVMDMQIYRRIHNFYTFKSINLKTVTQLSKKSLTRKKFVQIFPPSH